MIQQEIGQILTDAGIVYSSVNEQGHPVSQICATAQQEKVDLIVMGSRGMGSFQALTLGSVSSRVAHQAHGSLLIVR